MTDKPRHTADTAFPQIMATRRNPAREALARAVNRAIASGAPVYENQPAARTCRQDD